MIHSRICLAALISFFTVACSAAINSSKTEQNGLPAAASRTYAQNYQDMALAYCVSKAYAAEPDANKDATATAGALNVWGNYDADNSAQAIPKLVSRYLSRHYASIHGNSIKLDLLKCIDMYHSKELIILVKKYVPEPKHSYVQDNPPPKN